MVAFHYVRYVVEGLSKWTDFAVGITTTFGFCLTTLLFLTILLFFILAYSSLWNEGQRTLGGVSRP